MASHLRALPRRSASVRPCESAPEQKPVNPVPPLAIRWARGGAMWARTITPSGRSSARRGRIQVGHVENRCHGVKKTINYKPMDGYE